ncbi:MAG: STAS domain-containing protein [Solirubrobacteraceae bacterium]
MPTPDSIARRAAALRPFVCSSTGGGLDATWVHVAGALDLATSPQLQRLLDEASARLVVLDLRDLAFMDSSGVHTIVDASVRARRDGRRLILLRGTRDVDRVFTLTGTSGVVEIGDFGTPPEPPGQLRLHFADETLIP